MRIFFEDVQISFGLDKCAVLEINRGGQVDSTGRELPNDRQIGQFRILMVGLDLA